MQLINYDKILVTGTPRNGICQRCKGAATNGTWHMLCLHTRKYTIQHYDLTFT
jgi:hypothetical protein